MDQGPEYRSALFRKIFIFGIPQQVHNLIIQWLYACQVDELLDMIRTPVHCTFTDEIKTLLLVWSHSGGSRKSNQLLARHIQHQLH